jgi:hypothetical protein
MNADWDLVVADNIFCAHGYAIALRLNQERNVPFILMNTNGNIPTTTSTYMALSIVTFFKLTSITLFLQPGIPLFGLILIHKRLHIHLTLTTPKISLVACTTRL